MDKSKELNIKTKSCGHRQKEQGYVISIGGTDLPSEKRHTCSLFCTHRALLDLAEVVFNAEQEKHRKKI